MPVPLFLSLNKDNTKKGEKIILLQESMTFLLDFPFQTLFLSFV